LHPISLKNYIIQKKAIFSLEAILLFGIIYININQISINQFIIILFMTILVLGIDLDTVIIMEFKMRFRSYFAIFVQTVFLVC
jgi:hypothetical protein